MCGRIERAGLARELELEPAEECAQLRILGLRGGQQAGGPGGDELAVRLEQRRSSRQRKSFMPRCP